MVAREIEHLDAILSQLATDVRNSTIESAAAVAELYGAPPEAVEHILKLKGEERKP
jgi:hypothetical protein